MPNQNDALHLHYSDLKLLMENYQNVIRLNTLLLEQQKQLIALQKELSKNQDVISDRQAKIRDRINKMIDKVDTQADIFKQTTSLIQVNYNDLEKAMHDRFDSTVTKIEGSKNSVDLMNVDMIKQHSSITNKLYVAFVGSVLIILALIGTITSMFGKFKILEHVHEMLDKVMIFFKII